jgi:hypothetical protein
MPCGQWDIPTERLARLDGLIVDDLENLKGRFMIGHLTKAEWNHSTKVQIMLYLVWLVGGSAFMAFKYGAAATHKAITGEEHPFHYTATMAYFFLFDAIVKAHPTTPIKDLIIKVMQSPIADPGLLTTLYSKSILISEAAKVRFIKPDLMNKSFAAIAIDSLSHKLVSA